MKKLIFLVLLVGLGGICISNNLKQNNHRKECFYKWEVIFPVDNEKHFYPGYHDWDKK